MVEYHFHAAVARAGMTEPALHQPGAEERARHQAALRTHADQLRRWATITSAKFQPRAAVTEALVAVREGRVFEAMRLFEDAIRTAREQGLVPVEAMAHEMAARLFAAHGFGSIAQSYFRNARDGFLRWGATAKVQQLERRHRLTTGSLPGSTDPPKAMVSSETLDFGNLVRTSRAVSGETGTRQLIRTLMFVVLEHAGADRGLLVLPRAGKLRIEAEAVTAQDGIEVRQPGRPVRRPLLRGQQR